MALPLYQSEPSVISDAASKRQIVRAWLRNNNLSGVVISRRDQFAWLTCGGDNRVLHNSEVGFAHAVITHDRHYLVAQTMDATRVLEEQVPGQAYDLVSLHWYDCDPRAKALELAGPHPAADTLLPGALECSAALSQLHYPLSSVELNRVRWLGEVVDRLLHQLALSIEPGETEEAVAHSLHSELIHLGIEPDVLILGSDERIARYRHPLPTRKPIQRYVLVHPAARRWGLHANVTRSIHFGTPPAEIAQAYRAAATLQANIFSVLREGLPFAEILNLQKQWYAALGYPDEWRNHYQGGPTGYLVVDTGRNQGDTLVQNNQTFDWFVTVTGAKVEELSLLTAQGVEIASYRSQWPAFSVETAAGTIRVPDLWIMG